MTKSEETRLFSKMLMIGQLKKRVQRTNKNIQTSLLMGILFAVSFPGHWKAETANPPVCRDGASHRKLLS